MNKCKKKDCFFPWLCYVHIANPETQASAPKYYAFFSNFAYLACTDWKQLELIIYTYQHFAIF
ncbi:hypothetical protein T01_13088 [Trichinella spiralis]|uniref:Uncharacterized protein n=1 Tax=Trichinella spiralis TaxID=6334 RepID=A0A0V1B810_TRISP|nr:hypothetical protein T01_13088 [Trichinella spiralis]